MRHSREYNNRFVFFFLKLFPKRFGNKIRHCSARSSPNNDTLYWCTREAAILAAIHYFNTMVAEKKNDDA